MVSKKKVKKKKKKKKKKNIYIFFLLFLIGKTDMVLGKKWLFSIEHGAEIQSLEKGRTPPEYVLVEK